jgi:pilus assembly protein CpaB
MRAKSLILLLIALGCGLVASVGITQVMAKRTPDTTGTEGDREGVFVAKKDIGVSDPISAQNVKLEPWPKEMVPPGAMLQAQFDELTGRLPKVPIGAGSPILESQLQPKGGEKGASARIEKGFRVVPVKVDISSASGGIIRPGDRVDVLVHVKADAQKGIPASVTRTVLQDVKVFAVNDIWDTTSDEKAVAAKSIHLLVKPEDAEVLTLATELGNIRLVMRSPWDDERKELPGQGSHGLLGTKGKGEGRDAEEAKASDGNPASIMEMLKQIAGQKTPPPIPAATPAATPAPTPPTESEKPVEEEPNQRFTVRILSGTQLTETVLEGGKKSEHKDNPHQWHVDSSHSTSFDAGDDGAKQQPPKAAAVKTKAASRRAGKSEAATASDLDIPEKGKDMAPLSSLDSLQ